MDNSTTTVEQLQELQKLFIQRAKYDARLDMMQEQINQAQEQINQMIAERMEMVQEYEKITTQIHMVISSDTTETTDTVPTTNGVPLNPNTKLYKLLVRIHEHDGEYSRNDLIQNKYAVSASISQLLAREFIIEDDGKLWFISWKGMSYREYRDTRVSNKQIQRHNVARIIKYMRTVNTTTIPQIANKLGMSSTTIARLVRELATTGVIVKRGRGLYGLGQVDTLES